MKNAILVLSCILFYGCFPETCGIDYAGDSGFNFVILNYSDMEYKGVKLYAGTYDNNDKYVKLDSLILPNLIVPKFNEGESISVENKYSFTLIDKSNSTGLNQHGRWVPPTYNKIKEYNDNDELVYLFVLEEKHFEYTDPIPFRSGELNPTILVDGSLFW